jgi:hypothetical protein
VVRQLRTRLRAELGQAEPRLRPGLQRALSFLTHYLSVMRAGRKADTTDAPGVEFEFTVLLGWLIVEARRAPANCGPGLRYARWLLRSMRDCYRETPADDQRQFLLLLGPRFLERQAGGPSDCELLASWLRELPLQQGWVVGLRIFSDHKSQILVQRCQAPDFEDVGFVLAAPALPERIPAADAVSTLRLG